MFDMGEDRTKRQVVYYDAGVGTGWRKVTGNASGVGFSKNIRQAYQFIVHQSVLDRRALGLAPIERKPKDTIEMPYDPWILAGPPGSYEVEPWKRVESVDWYKPFGWPEQSE